MQPLSVVLFLLFVCLTSAYYQRTISANGSFVGRDNYTISVCNGGLWGTWAWPDLCPEKTFAIGFSIKVEEYGGPFSDDTSLNGIRLYCSRSRLNGSTVMYTVESESGIFGKWSNVTWCPDDSVLTAFELKMDPPRNLLGDETAVNNIKFLCSKGAILEAVGGKFGDYGMWSPDCFGGGICGIQTRQQPYSGITVDDTTLNDVHFYCCE